MNESLGRRDFSLRTRLLVAADGTRSLARDAFGIASDEYDYGQTLVVCSIATDRAPVRCASSSVCPG